LRWVLCEGFSQSRGQTEKDQLSCNTAGQPPIAEVPTDRRHSRSVPEADLAAAPVHANLHNRLLNTLMKRLSESLRKSNRVRTALLAIKEIGLHQSLAFDFKRAARLETERAAQRLPRRGGDVNVAG
jgi:hypothetical protein